MINICTSDEFRVNKQMNKKNIKGFQNEWKGTSMLFKNKYGVEFLLIH